MNLGGAAGSPNARADLGWIVEHASGLARVHGRSLFRVRSWALRASSAFAFLGVVVARECISNRWAKVAVLLASLLPVLVTAPGERAATLGVARGRDATLDDLSRCMERALPYAALVVTRWVLVRLASLFVFPVGAWLSIRLILVGFVMVDSDLGIAECLRRGFALTEGRVIGIAWLEVQEALDAGPRYGLFRAGIDGRIRRVIGEALLYEFLSGRIASKHASTPASTPAPPVPRAPPVRPPHSMDPDHPRCPRCDVPLRSIERAGIVLDRCATCVGVWIDNTASRALAEGVLSPEVVTSLPEPARELAPVPDSVDVAQAIRCPRCAAVLTRSFVPAAGIAVDACAAHGTWFDRGELERAHVGFEKARRDRAEIAALQGVEPPGLGSAYARAPGEMLRGAGRAIRAVARTGADALVEGREEDREQAVVTVVEAAIDALLRGEGD
jgi:Zn-finger nucleic acid-binding protein